ncbi:deoxyuridine 5'-triphosphate nucleotidohydrolase-like [Hydra vulgaris]|uniref:dUTP diphosphatase n=1 Tax=Hydra vulgaris TaxID=6087 RepID=A0ABM4CLW5_HYDVU
MAEEEKQFYENTRLAIIIKTIDTEEWYFYETKHSACFDLRSIAYKYGVGVFNAPGIIDADYKDENKVLLYNTLEDDYIINRGDAVAQMGFIKTLKALKIVTEIDGCSCRDVTMTTNKDVERNGGFGSTGK